MSCIIIGDITDQVDIPGEVFAVGSDQSCQTHFDNATDTWTVSTADGRTATGRTLVSIRPSDDRTVAVHGMPNYFRVPGPSADRQIRFVKRCLALLEQTGATRIEAKSRIALRGWLPQPVASRFYLTGSVPDDDAYEGPATLSLVDETLAVQARLTGHLDANDGQFHWRGTITGELPDDLLKSRRAITLTVAGQSASAQITERTPWGGYTVVGIGQPPFTVDD